MNPIRRTNLRTLAVALALAAPLVGSPLAVAATTSSQSTQFSVTGGSLSFGTAPLVPNFAAVTLNGQSQTDPATMNSPSIIDATGGGAGWNVTANGDATGTHSAVFKQYCSNGANPCGSDAANSYVTGGYTLPAGSLTLTGNATFAGLNGTTGTAPNNASGSPYALDAAAPGTKLLTAPLGAGMGTWQATYGANGLSVTVPTTTHVLPTNEVYHLDLLWTLGTGP